jgi:aspartate/methionine/tyrosine aminotransferase
VTTQLSPDIPAFAIDDPRALVPVNDYPSCQVDIPQSKMFLIKKMLENYRAKVGPSATTFDASQGDGGASLPGVPHYLLERAAELFKQKGTGYDQPYGTDNFRKATAEQYWQFDAATGFGPQNITATDGGRDGLLKAYQAMISLGTGRIGDALLVSRVPWISYTWGPYGVGMNVLLAPGHESDGWAYSEEGIEASVEFAAKNGNRRIAGLVITSPDNPTGRTIPMQRQIALAKKALDLGVPFVLFDWIYHQVTAGDPANINDLLNAFSAPERERLIVLDGLTKSLGASNVRNAHLVAGKKVIDFIVSRASHGIAPNFFGQAVALAAYEVGFREAIKPLNTPINESREIVRSFLAERGYRVIIGEGGYYAFVDCSRAIEAGSLEDSVAFNAHLAEGYGLTTIPGRYFSEAGRNWVRFSYALPPEKTRGALERFDEGFRALTK